MDRKPEERFTGLVDDYEKYRPGYPAAIIEVLTNEYDLRADTAVADIGSGTGKLSALFLGREGRVFGVEPNADMRGAAERLFAGRPDFISVDGAAEKTGLPDQSVDCVVVGTAFHWFDWAKTKIEFTRILKPNGTVALIWNRRDRSDEFMLAYDRVLAAHCAEYPKVDFHMEREADTADFFTPAAPRFHEFASAQRFDLTGFLGRVRSSSYCPRAGTPEYARLETELKKLFAEWQKNDAIEFKYRTVMYVGRL